MHKDEVMAAIIPQNHLGFIIWKSRHVKLEPHVGSMKENYGFGDGSAQDNFLRSDSESRLVGLLYSTKGTKKYPPRAFDDARVVARVFGEFRFRSKHVDIWYVGVNKRHGLNNSHGGTLWGVKGIKKHNVNGRIRWFHGDRVITSPQMAKGVIEGKANPYAVYAITEFMQALGAQSAEQNSSLPCAQFFHKSYDHATHPALMHIYQESGFDLSPMGNYVHLDLTTKQHPNHV